jgi:tetratricopeptide (TPR) repeat protein
MSEEKTPEPSKVRSKRGSSRKNRWEAEASELRVRRIISNLGFWAGTFIIATLLGIVISQQVRMNNVIETVQHYEEELNTDIELSTGVGLALAANRLPEYMLDELAEIEADQVPEAKIELNAYWVKQAGMYLVRAEKAYEEERFNTAITHYNDALAILPSLDELHQFIGLIHLQKKSWDEAISSFTRSIESGHISAGIHNNLGVAYRGKKEFPAALEQFDKALQLDPQYPKARYNLAALNYEEDAYPIASKHFQKFVDKYPSHVEAARMYAECLMHQQQWAPAIEQLMKVTREYPDDAPPHFKLAKSLAMIQATDDAKNTLRHAVSLADAETSYAWVSKRAFRSLRQDSDIAAMYERLSRATGKNKGE